MNDFTTHYDYDKTFYMRPIGFHVNSSSSKTTIGAGTSIFHYMGKAPKHIENARIFVGLSPIPGMSASYAEFAVLTGKFIYNSNTALSLVGYTDIREYYNSHTANKLFEISFPLNRMIMPMEDVWIGIGCGINYDIFTTGVTDQLNNGVSQTFSGRISTNFSSNPTATTISAVQLPWILIV